MSEDGSEDTPPRPKRKIKKLVLMSSGSSSDSDESITSARTRRKRLRVLSDDGSESSGSSVVRVGFRRNRPLPKLRDSDGDSDTSGWATDHSDPPQPAPTTAKPHSGFASDSSEGNSDKCSICLLRFTDQAVGTPQSCEHLFCLDCITEWSKNVNTCPVDRMTFDSIVVRTCAGGRVLRTEPVKVVERRPSIELLVTEDPTVCEVCGSTENEETMLLCDGCDLGYHMQCLTPPLTEVPLDQWLCPNCDELLSDVDVLFSGINDIEADLDTRRTSRQSRSARSRNRSVADEPSTSTGGRGNRLSSADIPSTSQGSRTSNSSSRIAAPRRTTTGYTTNRRRHKRRRTRAVVIEYELQETGKVAVMKRVKRKQKKKKTKRRQPRTAARRTHVRASVRAKLVSMSMGGGAQQAAGGAGGARGGAGAGAGAELRARRRRAGIPALSLFGADELDYFSDDEHGISEGASTAVAVRPTASILSAYRQARRKMISVPSPPHAAAAPDVLSSILESQTLLHSKQSVVSITVHGDVNIKLETRERAETPKREENKKEKVDLTQGEDAAKKVPSYPGQSRGGGWGGGYRGSYHREQNTNNFSRGGNHENSYQGYHNRQGNQYQNNMRRDDSDAYNNYSRRPHNDDVNFDRSRRLAEQNRPNLPLNQRQEQGRYSVAPSRQPYTPPPAGQPYTPPPAGQYYAPPPSGQPYTPPPRGPRPEAPAIQHRHSFGGFENPLDMRVGQITRQTSLNTPMDVFPGVEAARPQKQHQSYNPLPEPPLFKFDKRDVDKSEDEKSDSGLVIDTEKYDPTEPTNDESGDEDKEASAAAPPLPPAPLPALPPSNTVQSILAGIDTSAMNVPANVLDSAVRQVLKEHRNLIVAPSAQSHNDKSDEDSDGDCPNFSIYSATSVHIANNTSDAAGLAAETPRELPEDNLEDLVQEDDETPVVTPESGSTPVPPETVEPEVNYEKEPKPEAPTHTKYSSVESIVSKLRKTDEELNEKISKRCPITTNIRNPIKIKLNTPSLIKRQMTLYDDEEIIEDIVERTESPKQKEEEPSYKHSPEKERKSMENKLNQKSESINESNKPLYDEESIQEEVESTNKAAKPAAPSDSEDDSSTKADRAKMVVDDDKRDDRSENDEDTESEKRGTSEKSTRDPQSDDENDDLSGVEDSEIRLDSASPGKSVDRNDDLLEKMTESISETEDERSYTPCLDENKSKDTSLETDKDKGIEGLDTEMISEDEGNEMFSDTERVPSDAQASPQKQPADGEEGEIVEKKKETSTEEPKKKKKKESKKEGKEKKKGKKGEKGEIAFKKLSKSGKERNYRERDKDKDKEGKNKRQRRESSEGAERQKQRRKERRKDLERYDVRSLVTEKRRRPKDPFGRDVSPRLARSRSRSPSAGAPRSSTSRERGSASRLRRSASRPRRSLSRPRRSSSRPRRSPSRPRRSSSRPRRSASRPRRSPSRLRRSPSRPRRSPSRVRRSPSPPARRRSSSRPKRSPSAVRARPRRASSSPRRAAPAPSPRSASPLAPAPPRVARKRRRSADRAKRPEVRRRRSADKIRKRKRSASGSRSPRPKPSKRKKRVRASRSASRRRSPRRRRRAVRQPTPAPSPPPAAAAGAPGSVDSRLLSPRTPPPEPSPPPAERRRHRRPRDAAGPSKEVFTSGDNILVSVSFAEQERAAGAAGAGRREARRERRRARGRRRAPAAAAPGLAAPAPAAPRPVAIIDLERSPFRELTPSPRNVIVLSDSEPGDKEDPPTAAAPAAAAAEPAHPPLGPQTPPEPAAQPAPAPAEGGPSTPPDPPESPDAYDPYEPTRSASASPASAHPPSPQRTMMTLETAQKTNMSADDVIDRRPLSPIEKVMALLQSTRDVSPEPPPGECGPPGGGGGGGGAAGGAGDAPPAAPALAPPAPAPAAPPAPAPPVRIVLPSPTRSQPPKLFLAKPSPIKSDPIKPMQMQTLKLSRALPLPAAVGAALGRRRSEESGGDSPYSPGSSDFGDLFEPPGAGGGGAGGVRNVFDALVDRPHRNKKSRSSAAKVPVKLNKKKGKTQVGVKIAEDNLKILDDLPSSAVEMQVKSKFLKKLNRQERVVEEVKLVLKPHYNKKHVTKDEYKDILRRAVPKICHNKTGEINPAKIQSLVEAYVKKFRKKHKLGLA